MSTNKKKYLKYIIAAAVIVAIWIVAGIKGGGQEAADTMVATLWSMVPPIIAIVLALITKEVYSSLLIGIISGALFYTGFHPVRALETVLNDGIVASLTDKWNMGIIVFLVLLGILVSVINKAGGSAAYGEWAVKHIKSRKSAMLATFILGVVIFIDDYFNCLTVGSVMKPVTDSHKISRAKLAYIIDATAAPICMIAPISSWAAAVSGLVEGQNGIAVFVSAIPFNFYSILTFVMIIFLAISQIDFGPMKKHEWNAKTNDDLFTSGTRHKTDDVVKNPRAGVIDLVFPVIVLIICCVVGMIYTGGFFEGANFIDAFANSDASVGLMSGAFVALIITLIFYLCRRVLSFKSFMESIPKGFIAMVPAIIILTFAWSLKAMTGLLGATDFVETVMAGSAEHFQLFLPVIIFIVAMLMAFATGTSWGTFGILIPIVCAVFGNANSTISIIAISACLAGAVCGDHCSPISDTTIMSSAGAGCDHVNHVSTQLPYALTVAAVSAVNYLIAGFLQKVIPSFAVCAVVSIVIGIGLMILTLAIIRHFTKWDRMQAGAAKKAAKEAAKNQ
ncbi:MAG: Na+/H+ antiporter NhaC family protein [Lachnospiraceae bacterium]|nr:Na+/H+ antiporter NhaC family protein [Lachnospiraceae bacterium]